MPLQELTRHLSCVGQIQEAAEEAAEGPAFWGMDSPTVRMSPLRKRLPVVWMSRRSMWDGSPGEEGTGEVDEPLSPMGQGPAFLTPPV